MNLSGMKKVTVLFAAIVFFAGSWVSAQINYNLDNNYSPTPLTGQYVFDGVTKMTTTNATFDSKAGFVFIAMEPVSTNRYFTLGTSSIPYQIYKTNVSMGDQILYSRTQNPTTTNAAYINLTQATNNVPYSFYIMPTSGLIRKPGLYSPSSSVIVTLNSGTLSGTSITNTRQRASATISNLKLNVPVIGDLSILPENSTTFSASSTTQTVDFSPTSSDGMYEGKEKSINVVVRTNGTWSLTMETVNGVVSSGKWVMKANTDANEYVPYSVYVNDTLQTLSSTTIYIRQNAAWPESSDERANGFAILSVKFRIGPFFSIPDTYTDTIRLVLSAS